jgi:hypothetical protein
MAKDIPLETQTQAQEAQQLTRKIMEVRVNKTEKYDESHRSSVAHSPLALFPILTFPTAPTNCGEYNCGVYCVFCDEFTMRYWQGNIMKRL